MWGGPPFFSFPFLFFFLRIEYWTLSDCDVSGRPEFHKIVKFFNETKDTVVKLSSLVDSVAAHPAKL